MIVAVHETLRGGLLGPADAEPLAMLLFMTAVGTVVVKHVFHNERRVAAVGRELDTARRIQQSILPRRPPAIDGIAVAAFYDPMTEVAGDFYDFVVTPTGRLGVLVADVSGHGVPAALVASMVKIALATQGEDVEDPGVVLTRMNRALSGRFELAYVTAVFALIDPRARTVSYAAAGHPPPWLLRADGRLAALDARGLVLGLVADTTYETATVAQLAPGDALVFYTDGLTEAGRPEGELFGDRAFHTTLAERRGQPADRITSDLAAAARRWVDADFADDVTIVVASLTDVAT
jgi:sigma-B regulation protein RsbU (phosphoserine phosphatase)